MSVSAAAARGRDSRLFGVLQRVGRSFMLPIALLPIAGLLLGIGSSLTNPAMIAAYHLESVLGPGTVLGSVLSVLSSVGSIIFDNLPILFAMGVALGMAENVMVDPLHDIAFHPAAGAQRLRRQYPFS